MDTVTERTRWSVDELEMVAGAVAKLRAANPVLTLLDAVREAQNVLPEDRRREIKQWAAVKRLEPILERLEAEKAAGVQPQAAGGAAGAAGASGAPGLADKPADDPDQAAGSADASAPADSPTPALPIPSTDLALLDDSAIAETPSARGPREPQAGESGEVASAFDPRAVEEALLTALKSPAIEAALTELLARILASVLPKGVPAGPLVAASSASKGSDFVKVLVAGFAETEQRLLQSTLSPLFDVRVWRQTQGPQVFAASAKLCDIAVVPEGVDDEVEETLRGMDVKVVRHEGNPDRLLERVSEMAAG